MEGRKFKDHNKFQKKFLKIIINKILTLKLYIKDNKKGFLIIGIKVGLLPLLTT